MGGIFRYPVDRVIRDRETLLARYHISEKSISILMTITKRGFFWFRLFAANQQNKTK